MYFTKILHKMPFKKDAEFLTLQRSCRYWYTKYILKYFQILFSLAILYWHLFNTHKHNKVLFDALMYFYFFWEVIWFPSIALLGVLHNYKTISNIAVTALGEKSASYTETVSNKTHLNTTGEIVHLKNFPILMWQPWQLTCILCSNFHHCGG